MKERLKHAEDVLGSLGQGKSLIISFENKGWEYYSYLNISAEYFFINSKHVETQLRNYLKNNSEFHQKLVEHNARRIFEDKVDLLLRCLLKKDAYTAGHTKRVSQFSVLIAKELQLSKEEQYDIKFAGLLHDIGKIGIHDNILKKESALDPDEFDVMKMHPVISEEIIQGYINSKPIIDGVRYHHEKFNGSGYPDGLKGEEIPLTARVISVADTFDALISHRPYRKATSPKKSPFFNMATNF